MHDVAPMADISRVFSLTAQDMQRLDEEIRHQLSSDVALVNQISQYIIKSGGKRLRPMIALLAARSCGCGDVRRFQLAAVIEFIHTATLLHDDVVDDSPMRRGKSTAHMVWGSAASVLVGDFLYSRAFQMMVALDDMRIMSILADTTNHIAEGEVLQLMNMGDPDTSEERYFKVIQDKTARLFSAAAQLGAILSRSDPVIENALAEYGLQLGIAFQIADDILDYTANEAELGKALGDDLAEGKPTLPLIIALQRVDAQSQSFLRACIEQSEPDNLVRVLAIIEQTGALDECIRRADKASTAARAALEPLPDSDEKTALIALAEYALNRTT